MKNLWYGNSIKTPCEKLGIRAEFGNRQRQRLNRLRYDIQNRVQLDGLHQRHQVRVSYGLALLEHVLCIDGILAVFASIDDEYADGASVFLARSLVQRPNRVLQWHSVAYIINNINIKCYISYTDGVWKSGRADDF